MKLLGISTVWAVCAVLLAVTSAAASGPDGNNPWRELSPETRAGLVPFLGPVAPFQKPEDDGAFSSWYKTYYPSGTPGPESVYAEFRYNSMTLGQRISAACIFREAKSEVLDHLSTPMDIVATMTTGNGQASVILQLSNPQDWRKLYDALVKLDFNNYYCAGPKPGLPPIPHCEIEKGPPKAWGLRSPHDGTGLHWYQEKGDMETKGLVAVHIDYFNPGKWSFDPATYVARAAEHIHNDLLDWDKRTLLQMFSVEPNACGVGAADQVRAALDTQAQLARESQNQTWSQKLKSKLGNWIDCIEEYTPLIPMLY